MPFILARGETTTLDKEAHRLIQTIERLIGSAIDGGHGNAQNTCGVFSVEVYLVRQEGAGFGDRAKNRNAIDIDVTIPLEYATFASPYPALREARKDLRGMDGRGRLIADREPKRRRPSSAYHP